MCECAYVVFLVDSSFGSFVSKRVCRGVARSVIRVFREVTLIQLQYIRKLSAHHAKQHTNFFGFWVFGLSVRVRIEEPKTETAGVFVVHFLCFYRTRRALYRV